MKKILLVPIILFALNNNVIKPAAAAAASTATNGTSLVRGEYFTGFQTRIKNIFGNWIKIIESQANSEQIRKSIENIYFDKKTSEALDEISKLSEQEKVFKSFSIFKPLKINDNLNEAKLQGTQVGLTKSFIDQYVSDLAKETYKSLSINAKIFLLELLCDRFNIFHKI